MSSLKGGDKLSAVLQRMAGAVTSAQSVKIGFLAGSSYPDGTPVPLIAAINEFGAPSRGQPPRPFMRNMIAAKSPEWPDAIANLLKANDYDADKTLAQVGEAVAGQLRESIMSLVDPPLAPSTIRAKGHGKPLIDTGHLLASVDYEVTK